MPRHINTHPAGRVKPSPGIPKSKVGSSKRRVGNSRLKKKNKR